MYPAYPVTNLRRDEWIVSQRGSRERLDALRPQSFFIEEEPSQWGETVSVATLFLTNRECPWHCVMCDLWKNTLTESVPLGAIPGQIDYALTRLSTARQVKLYNSGSFFDPRAIPVEDYHPVAARLHAFERVIVESHPGFVGDRCLQFRDLLPGRLEVAMGLETVHPAVLPRLNKRMTLEQFSAAAHFLRRNNIDLRVFILVQPPFMRANESIHWAERSLDFAFDHGATAATLILTRGGNGAMETLATQGHFVQPRLRTLEAAMSYGLSLGRGRVFSDLWALESFALCSVCKDLRVSRLREMNLSQCVAPSIACPSCEGES